MYDHVCSRATTISSSQNSGKGRSARICSLQFVRVRGGSTSGVLLQRENGVNEGIQEQNQL